MKHTVHIPVTGGKPRLDRVASRATRYALRSPCDRHACNGSPRNGGRHGLSGGVHLDRRAEADGQAAIQDQDRRTTAKSRPSGASTVRAPNKPPATTRTASCARCSIVPDPIRGGDDVLVMCEVLEHRHDSARVQHPRRLCRDARAVRRPRAVVRDRAGVHVLQGWPPHGWPVGGYPAPQGGYYCGVGADEIWGRDVVEDHTKACLDAGIAISGTNAEVMIGQWEFQIGPLGPVEVVRSALAGAVAALPHRRGLRHLGAPRSRSRSRATGTVPGRTPTSPRRRCARTTTPIIAACEALGKAARRAHRATTAPGSSDRLTGLHETAPWTEYSYGVSDRGASVRIPWQMAKEGKGYIEDRRPNANMDPYVVTRLITDTVCSYLGGETPRAQHRRRG